MPRKITNREHFSMRLSAWIASLIIFVGASIQGVRFYRDWHINQRCTELFDAKYYVERYPEVKSSGLSPLGIT